MRKNNGFTLAELLAVIAILGLMALLAIPAVSNASGKQREKLYYDQLNQLILATQNWATDNSEFLRNELEENCENSYTVTIPQLQNIDSTVENALQYATYLDKNFTNPKTGKPFNEGLANSEKVTITIYKEEKNYLYCINNCDVAKYNEYKNTTAQICCNGNMFEDRLEGCKNQ